jgi:hypothetical protein
MQAFYACKKQWLHGDYNNPVEIPELWTIWHTTPLLRTGTVAIQNALTWQQDGLIDSFPTVYWYSLVYLISASSFIKLMGRHIFWEILLEFVGLNQ